MDPRHLEFDDALARLSVPALAHDPLALSRRRFLQGAVAVAGGLALPALRPGRAHGASPVGPNDGILVVVFLGGGNDALNTLAPISGPARGHYERLRGGLAIPAAGLRPVGSGWGLNPSLVGVHRRFQSGQVALVQGSGMPEADLSHFTATAKSMQGSTTGMGSGWLGRYLDEVSEHESGMRGVTISTSIPLYLVGRRAKVTALPSTGGLWGADRTAPGEKVLVEAVRELGAGPTGLGTWGDQLAETGRAAVDRAAASVPLYDGLPEQAGLIRDLVLAARVINSDVGARVVGVGFGGWDTHALQASMHGNQLALLDQAIEAFFANLSRSMASRVTLLVQSEFGRRPEANASFGTDHGTAGLMMLVGRNVQGGLHSAPPALDRLDDRGNLVPTVDFRAVYASLLSSWLGGDAGQVLGGAFPGLQLIGRSPGT